ncbi:MAG: HDOD domain-containing protein [Planctomycetota bacterium]|nr:MAG: HDOD domain-containing protein [Planctomycetota bacterium]
MSDQVVTEELPQITLEKVVARVEEISTLPQVALHVLETASDPESGATELKRVVEGDPSLSARVLKMVNSAAYGLARRCENLHQAISFLGFNQVRNLAMTASVSSVFKSGDRIGPYARQGLWKHLLSVGIAARLVATRCGVKEFEDAFLAGLLHDIGLIVLDQHAHAHFSAIMTNLDASKTLPENERGVLGFDHTRLGEALANTWRFPESTVAAIRHHHGSDRYKGEWESIVRSVEIANAICTVKGVTSVGVKLVRPPLEAFRAAGFNKEDIVVLATDLDAEIDRHKDLFEI